MMGMQALVILSNVDGVYTGDPYSATRLITEIQEADRRLGMISENRSSLGRGGMATKYRTATKAGTRRVHRRNHSQRQARGI